MKSSCHQPKETYSSLDLEKKRKIVLVGNPNVGKSIFFAYLSKNYTNVSNYPGTTIDLSHGNWGDHIIIDTPGIYSVSSQNDEETVARSIILEADVVINVVDAVRLERDLFLTQQLVEMGKPIVIALNFMDEAKDNALEIDVNQLSKDFGVPVIPTIAKDGFGLKELEDSIKLALPGKERTNLVVKLAELQDQVGSQSEALLALEGDSEILKRYNLNIPDEKEMIYNQRRKLVNEIVSRVVKEKISKVTLSDRLGRWSIQPLMGTLILIGVLYILYLVIGQLIAGNLVDFTEKQIMQENWTPLIQSLVGEVLDKDNPLYIILVGEFGLLTMTISYLIGLLLPLVFGFYVMFALLEDSGYLPRLATLVDSLLMKIGLNGRAVIPIMLGFGCVQLGTITTRLLGTKREKQIASAILNFTIPCSAQLGVITVMLAGSGIGAKHVFLYIATIFGMFVFIGTVLNKLLPGKSLPLLMDLPPMRLPKSKNILRKTLNRTYFFMKEASPWFFLGAFFVSVLQVTGGLKLWIKIWSPITESWLKLPKETATSFIYGMVRRDFGAAGLHELQKNGDLDPFSAVVSLIVITLFVPCIASFMILLKERGIKEGVLIWIGALGLSFVVGGIIAQIGSFI